MPDTATYAYDAQASASFRARPDAASSAVADGPQGARVERVVGVFRFRQSCAVKVTMAGDRFFAERLRSPDQPFARSAASHPGPAPRATAGGALSRWQTMLADVLAGVLYRVRSALGRPGGDRWELSGRERAEMEGHAYALAAREEQQRLASDKHKAMRAAEAARDRELHPATLPAMPDTLVARIGSFLPAPASLHQACAALAEGPEAARASARSVSTLSALQGVVRQWLQPPSAASHRPTLSATARGEVAGMLAKRLRALPEPQQRAGACAVLKALDAELIRTGQAAGALLHLAQSMASIGSWYQPMPEWPEARLLEAIRGMPAASRVGPCLALLKHGTKLQQEEAARHLMPSADWVGPSPSVPASRQGEVVQGLMAWCKADRSWYRFDIWEAMLRFAVELPDQVVVAAPAEGAGAYGKSTVALKSMVLSQLLRNAPHSSSYRNPQWPWEKADASAAAPGKTGWDRLFEMAAGWPLSHATPVIAGLLGTLTYRTEQDRAMRLEQVERWVQQVRPSPEQRLAIELAAFHLRTPEHGVAHWPRLWTLWTSSGSQREMATGLRILDLFRHRPDRANWASELLPRLGALQPAERAALLAGVPAEMFRDVKEPILAEEVEYLATMGHLEPMARWIERYRYDKEMLAPIRAAFARLPAARQAECLLHIHRGTRVPKSMVNAVLHAIEQRQIDAATAASVIGALADRFAARCKEASTGWGVDIRLIARLADLLPQVDASHDADLLARLAHLADVMQMRARWSKEPAAPALARRIRDAAWKAIGGDGTDTHIRRAALDALFPLLVDREGYLKFSAQTYTDALAVATTLPAAERADMLVKLERLERRLDMGYGTRHFDPAREALWHAIMTLPEQRIARGLALAAPWFLEPSRYGEPRQAEYEKAAREFDARWRAVPPEDRSALYPHQLEAARGRGATAGTKARH